VQNSQVEQNSAVIDGRAVWVSALQVVPRSTQTITLEEDLGGWRISLIHTKASAQVVESFYNYMSNSQWDKAKQLVMPETWKALESSGVLAKVKSGFIKKSPSITVYVKSVQEEQAESEIKADIVWLNPRELTVPVGIQAVKTTEGWMIQRINGGWPK
jgi:hypothetical protein